MHTPHHRSNFIHRRRFLQTLGASLALAGVGLTLPQNALLAGGRLNAQAAGGASFGTLTPFGCSILHGVGASRPAAGCTNLLAKALGADLLLRPEWAGGSAELLGKLDDWLASSPADLVLLHTATHDLNQPARTVASNTQKIIQRIQTQWGAQVLLVGTWGTAPGNALDQALAAVARSQGVPFAPLTAIFADPQLHTGGDNWHPNDAGHARIAAAMLAAIETAAGQA